MSCNGNWHVTDSGELPVPVPIETFLFHVINMYSDFLILSVPGSDRHRIPVFKKQIHSIFWWCWSDPINVAVHNCLIQVFQFCEPQIYDPIPVTNESEMIVDHCQTLMKHNLIVRGEREWSDHGERQEKAIVIGYCKVVWMYGGVLLMMLRCMMWERISYSQIIEWGRTRCLFQ